jgi:hypothetical protein
MRRIGNISQFSGQGKYFLYEILLIINVIYYRYRKDDAKRHYYSGNRHDAARDILTSDARVETLQRETPSCIREKRTFVKRRQE